MKNENTLLSTGSYIVSVIWFYAVAKPFLYDFPYLMLVSSLLGLYGMFLALRVLRLKELSVIGYLLILIGIVVTIIPIGILLLEKSSI